ncbi:MAG: zinc ABC transporter substrate-binding protein [Oculatellaceae cyanobacterium Prado106]|jgi:manganese/iron transport system substrate-binding protein|nr:zinc ABC transporter substrate-binding protein [Oculatellaceae cyanobacterium Prado106]
MGLGLTLKRIAVFAVMAGLASCAPAPQSTSQGQTSSDSTIAGTTAVDPNKPLVVATHTILCDLTRQIAADTVNLQCLMQGGVDPHVYQPTPADAKAIETAQLILYGGYNFEPGLIKLIQSSPNSAPKIAVDEVAVPDPLMGVHDHDHAGEAEAEAEAHDHDHDHAHEGEKAEGAKAEGELEPDPHVWHNAQNGVRIAEVIRENLSKAVPDQAAVYTENTQRVTRELTQLDSWIKAQVATIPANARKLVTTHDALGYFATAYGIPIEEALGGISTDQKPSADRVRTLVESVRASGVPTVFAETSINPALIETVAKEANVQVSDKELFADGLGEPGSAGDTYQKMLKANTEAIVQGLGGQFKPFQ